MQLVLQLTRDCNFACTYCYQAHRQSRGMSRQVAEAAIRMMIDAGHAHVAVTWFGGEPLLERERIEELQPRLLELGEAHGVLVTAKVSTNGALLDERFCRFAKDHALFVSLSADGCPQAQNLTRPSLDGTPTSALVERALAALVAARTPFATYSVVTPSTARLLPKSVDWLHERGARILISTLDFGAEWRAADLRTLERAYRALAARYRRWSRQGREFYLAPFDAKIAAHTNRRAGRGDRCAAGHRQIAIDPEGFVYPCIEFLESPAHRIGHVERGIDKDAFAHWRHEHGGERPSECSSCGIRERCGSTCACLNLRTAGSLHGVSELLCAHERAVTLAADRLGAALFAARDRTFLRRHYDPRHHVLSAIESLLEEARAP
ncbi:MAG: radical SAM protein [Planctomycetes bacterium]|nr:radical SAM protein [Planctomycetota bacterium]